MSEVFEKGSELHRVVCFCFDGAKIAINDEMTKEK